MKTRVDYLEDLLVFFIFLWILVIIFYLPSPISWLVLGILTLVIVIGIEMKGGE